MGKSQKAAIQTPQDSLSWGRLVRGVNQHGSPTERRAMGPIIALVCDKTNGSDWASENPDDLDELHPLENLPTIVGHGRLKRLRRVLKRR